MRTRGRSLKTRDPESKEDRCCPSDHHGHRHPNDKSVGPTLFKDLPWGGMSFVSHGFFRSTHIYLDEVRRFFFSWRGGVRKDAPNVGTTGVTDGNSRTRDVAGGPHGPTALRCGS